MIAGVTSILSADRHERIKRSRYLKLPGARFFKFYRGPSLGIIIARIFGVYGSIREASEHETRRKSLARVIRARRLTTVWLRVLIMQARIRCKSKRKRWKKRDVRRQQRRFVRIYDAYKLSCQLTNWKVRIGRTGFSMTAVRCYNCRALVL